MKSFLAAYFLVLPFQWALSPAPGVDLAVMRVATLLGVLFWLAWGLFQRKVFVPTGWGSVFWLCFLFFSTLSYFWATEQSFALRKILFLLNFAPIFFLVCTWLQQSYQERFFVIRAYVMGASLLAVVGIVLFLSQFLFGVEAVFAVLTQNILPFFLGDTFAQVVATYPSLLVNISGVTLLRASGVFPDPHMFAYYVGMAFPIACALVYHEKTRRGQWFTLSAILLLAHLLSFSRGGYVGLLAATLFVLLMVLFQARRVYGRSILIAIALSGIVILGAFSPFGDRFTSIFSQEDGSNKERIRLWQEAGVYIGENPFFGVGLGNYATTVRPGVGYREPIYAHNVYLDIALEGGLVSLAFFLGVFGVAFLRLKRVFVAVQDPMALALMATLVVFLGHSLFETPLFSVHVLPATLFLLALGVSYRYDRTGTE